jgi:hypothetical protein
VRRITMPPSGIPMFLAQTTLGAVSWTRCDRAGLANSHLRRLLPPAGLITGLEPASGVRHN